MFAPTTPVTLPPCGETWGITEQMTCAVTPPGVLWAQIIGLTVIGGGGVLVFVSAAADVWAAAGAAVMAVVTSALSVRSSAERARRSERADGMARTIRVRCASVDFGAAWER